VARALHSATHMKILTATLFALVPAVAVAQPASPPPAPMAPPEPLVIEKKAEPTNSINISPLGLIAGNIALTYEHLFNGTHGVIVEGALSRASGDDGDSLQFGGSVGYRWHWRGRQNSGFLGLMASQGIGTGKVTVNGMDHDMSVKSTTLTANIGKRWMITEAFNVTFRIGAGYGHYTATSKDDTMDGKQAEKTLNDLLSFLPVGFDGELSVGYAF